MAGAGWSALGAALTNGYSGFAQRQHDLLQQKQMELSQKLLQDQVNELPDKHAEDKLKQILALQGPDEAANDPQFAEIGRKLGILPQNQLPAAAKDVEGQSPLQVFQPSIGTNPTIKDVETPGGGGFLDTARAVAGPGNVAPRTGLPMPPHTYQFDKLKDWTGGETPYAFDQKTGQMHQLTTGQGAPTAPPIPGVPGATGAASGDPTAGMDPKMAQLAKMVANYEVAPSPRAAWWPSVMAAAKQINPAFDETQYGARQNLRKSFTSGADAQSIESANKLVHHLSTMASAGQKLGNGSFPPWNAAKNWFEQNLAGDGRPDAYLTAAGAVKDELGRLFRGTGAATNQEVENWGSRLGLAKSPEAQREVLLAAMELMRGRMDPVQSKWKNGMGAAEDYPIFNPESQKILEGLGFPGAAPSAPAPQGTFNGQPPAKAGAPAPALPARSANSAPANIPDVNAGGTTTWGEVQAAAALMHMSPADLKARLASQRVTVLKDAAPSPAVRPQLPTPQRSTAPAPRPVGSIRQVPLSGSHTVGSLLESLGINPDAVPSLLK